MIGKDNLLMLIQSRMCTVRMSSREHLSNTLPRANRIELLEQGGRASSDILQEIGKLTTKNKSDNPKTSYQFCGVT